MPTIVHFEIPADDVERAKKFYTDLFGWKIEKIPNTSTDNNSKLTSAATGQPIEYWIITTTDDKGNKASIGGGMMKRQMSEHHITNYISVNSIAEYTSKVEALGGKVFAPKHTVSGMGYFALCSDTENNVFAIWESDESAK
jgi:predicted enzyme related to lactoylglutathione lyase